MNLRNDESETRRKKENFVKAIRRSTDKSSAC